MGADRVAVLPPGLNYPLRFLRGIEDLPGLQFILHPAEEHPDISILPGTALLYMQRLDLQPVQPEPHPSSGALQSIVGTDMDRQTSLPEQLRQRFQDLLPVMYD